MQVASQTHTGCVREHNEDCLAVRQELGLLVLADGMGGHAAGEVASRLAVDTVLAQVEAGQTLEAAIQAAHAAIMAEASANPGKSGMGTTIVAVRLQGADYQAAWVGDSRVYQLFRGNGFERLSQVSRDHTPVQDLLEMGVITQAQARTHPSRNIISQALGACIGQSPLVETVAGRLQSGDMLLLCSDGLNGELEDRQIQDLLGNSSRTPSQVCDDLVQSALQSGGRDNVSVIVLQA